MGPLQSNDSRERQNQGSRVKRRTFVYAEDRRKADRAGCVRGSENSAMMAEKQGLTVIGGAFVVSRRRAGTGVKALFSSRQTRCRRTITRRLRRGAANLFDE